MWKELLTLVIIVGGPIAIASAVWDVWAQYRSARSSLASAIAITCISAGIPIYFVAIALEQRGPEWLREAAEVVGFGLFVIFAVTGVVGVVLDRRLRKAEPPQQRESDTGT